MTLLDWAAWIDTLETYAHLVLGIIAVYYLWLTLKGGEDAGPKVWGLGKEVGDKVWGGVKNLGRNIQRKSKRDEAKTLREFYEEKKELQQVEPIPDAVHNAITLIAQTVLEGQIKKSRFKDIQNHVDAITEDVEKAQREFRQVKRSTYRQQVETKRLLTVLRQEKSIDGSEVQEIEALEKEVLKKHDETEKALVTALKNITTLITAHIIPIREHMSSQKAAVPIGTGIRGGTIEVQLQAASSKLEQGVLPSIEVAVEAQRDALKSLDGFIAEFRNVWK